jgi:uncharacterized protein YPO0396
MAYTTLLKIRGEAGFQNNANVSDTTITQYQTRAYNLVRSFVAGRYDLTALTGANFTGSQAESVLEQCELLLAAGYLIQSRFQGQPQAEAQGKEKVADAMAILKQISSGELRLVGVDSVPFPSGTEPSQQGGAAEYTAPLRETPDPTYSEKKFGGDMRF